MSEVLGRIQERLAEIYDVEVMDVRPFLCDEEEAREAAIVLLAQDILARTLEQW